MCVCLFVHVLCVHPCVDAYACVFMCLFVCLHVCVCIFSLSVGMKVVGNQ